MASVNRNKLIQPRRQLTALLLLLSSSTALVPTVGAMLSWRAVGRQGGVRSLRLNLKRREGREKKENAENAKSTLDRTPRATPKKSCPSTKGPGWGSVPRS